MGDWIEKETDKLPFEIQGNTAYLKVYKIFPRKQVSGAYLLSEKVSALVCLVDLEITNLTKEDIYLTDDLTVIDQEGYSHKLLSGNNKPIPDKYVWFDDNNFGSEWLDPKAKHRVTIAFKPLKKGNIISAIRLDTNTGRYGDGETLEIQFKPELNVSDNTSSSKKSSSNYSDETFYIDKLNQIDNPVIRGNAFKIFLAGKKDNKESNLIIEEILSYLKDNNQMTNEMLDYFNTIKDERVKDEIEYERHSIPTRIKDQVWRRDEGKCIECGSNEKLEFDHIIPISKGGANTYRNIQLLCEPCNRRKSAKIG